MFRRLRLSYRHKIALSAFLIILLPLSIIYSQYFSRVYEEEKARVMENINSVFQSSSEAFNTMINTNLQRLTYISCYQELINFLSRKGEYPLNEITEFHMRIRPIFESLILGDPGTYIYVYSMNEKIYGDGLYLRSTDAFLATLSAGEENLLHSILALDNAEVLWRYRTAVYHPPMRTDTLSIFRKITSLSDTVGFVEVMIPIGKIKELFAFDLPSGAFVLFTTGNGIPPLLLNENAMDISLKDTIIKEQPQPILEYTTLNTAIKPVQGKVQLYIPNTYIRSQMRGFLIQTLLFALVIVAALLVITEIMSYFLTKRLTSLIVKMNRDVYTLIDAEELPVLDGRDEFSVISSKFMELIQTIKAYYQKIMEVEEQKKSLELELLQERFNPHFLYNTLDTIKWVYRNEKLAQVIDSMVRYYRIALNKGESIIELEQELNMIEEYMKLQKFTYESQFTYAIEVPAELRECLIIKHLLQPLVENAIFHGILSMESGGHIQISGCLDGDSMLITIQDNGAGMKADILKGLREGTIKPTNGGYGIKNVRHRIQAFYGLKYTLSIDSAPGQGTKVVLTLPVQRKRT